MRTRTSITDPLRINEVSCAPHAPGTVGVTFCPGKQGDSLFGAEWSRDLSMDVAAIAKWGARGVITLVEPHELSVLKVPGLGAEVERHGMRWLHLPIQDMRPPGDGFRTGWTGARNEVLSWIQGGSKVVVHCRGGLGRAGTVAACLLIELGCAPEDALRRVRQARPGAVETSEQERYVLQYRAPNLAAGEQA